MRDLCRVLGCLNLILGLAVSRGSEAEPDFGRDVRPLLAKHCFKCHGPDEDTREAGLRLDRQDAATEDLGGYAAIRPGDPDHSEMMARVTSEDEDERMPPGESPPLSDQEVAILRRWIESGGQYETHWAFVPPSRPAIPEVGDASWCSGEIDRFVLRRMESEGLEPSQRVSREGLMRRLYLDLTGTTPTPQEVDRFLADDRPTAYRRLVDRLLATPEYAERFARPWLDLARYSDTNGYEKDRPRSIWPYRDWVIDAIAADMPFDQFSIEQLAGDMLPDATNDQRIATGFHRNTMLNEEGGIDPLEYRFYAMVDRVATTGTVWMGLTTGCAQCHSHKYDPITHQDYYALFALLNNADEPDVIVEDPARQATVEQVDAEIHRIEQRLIDQYLPGKKEHFAGKRNDDPIAAEFVDWYARQARRTRRWRTIRPQHVESTMPKLTVLGDDSVLASGDVTKRDIYRLDFALPAGRPATALRLEVLPDESLPAGGPGLAFYEGRRGDFFLSELTVTLDGEGVKLQDPSHSFGKISVGSGSAEAANVIDGEGSTGWSTSGAEGRANQLVVNFAEPISGPGTLRIEMLFERHFAAALGRFRFSLTDGPVPVVASTLPHALADWCADDQRPGEVDDHVYHQLQRHFVRTSPLLSEARQEMDRLERSIPEVVRTLGMKERARDNRRTTHRHHRGEYLQAKEVVLPAVPAMFEPLGYDVSPSRLELARWLVGEKNPLVGRVTANRAWREFFGAGIVNTAGDFGTQSQPPTHPQLLDWLAVVLREGDWSLKRLHRQIVFSSTYRQSVSSPPPSDPRNQLLSVFPHRRLSAEQIRDTLLSASGLISRRVGGPSVFPPQPASVMQLAYGSPAWNVSQGGDRYRRSIYTFSKRTAPFAAFATFDGPTGETCLPRRDQSTTPLQALTLLNDEMYLELARGLANSTLRQLAADASPREIAENLFRRLLVRDPDDAEVDAMIEFYESQRDHDQPWMLVARALINTDEAITVP